ncbi:septal ring lytic transglycosylase RlpA family protein [Mastigocoleus sp. MO_188.B34]|uniref:septal ring lytic transglycosylase RlpA family protein n=1 Tax=Mastigocoleus sp. MO_188.B34 TaxID=3036635 RepID=UPI002638F2FC|nr:septal ring lytic transglycosylase RlpA family protein [Mastigocoleus sp. MO_188.B34]MDJ0697187.1 septal ring lytic transglycosylase RlpA family protein [Mastigocoleus sp. MO_188.B34]
MLFFGIIWVTSWFSAPWSFNQILPPSQPLTIVQKRVVSRFESSVSEIFPSHFNLWNVAISPSRFLKIDWKNETLVNSLSAPKSAHKTIYRSTKFCSSPQNIFPQSPQIQTKSSFPASIQLIKTRFLQQDFVSSGVMQSSSGWLGQALQKIFRFTSNTKNNLQSMSSAVLVIRRGKEKYEVWLKNHLIANLPNRSQANLMQLRLKRLLDSSNFHASKLKPAFINGTPALMAGNRFLFSISKEISRKNRRNPDLIAIEWINNLRSALQTPRLSLIEGQATMHNLKPSQESLSGFASWYGDYFHGRLTANGERYNQNEFTVAHKTLPFNTFLRVTNTQTGKAVIVRVNDRGPYIPPRSLDLSRVAARCIGSEKAGVVPYKAVIMKPEEVQFNLTKATQAGKNRKSPASVVTVSSF